MNLINAKIVSKDVLNVIKEVPVLSVRMVNIGNLICKKKRLRNYIHLQVIMLLEQVLAKNVQILVLLKHAIMKGLLQNVAKTFT